MKTVVTEKHKKHQQYRVESENTDVSRHWCFFWLNFKSIHNEQDRKQLED